jgi:hypothetical protein
MATRKDPFTQDALNSIFKIAPKHPDRISSHENSWLEFKESFGFASLSKYIRSAAAFANVKGGYIVYGIGDKPRKMLGLKNKAFGDLDPEKLSHYLNEHFAPEIKWEQLTYELGGRTFGLLYFHESENKPVVCIKNGDETRYLKEAEIYYRYSGRTQVIRYPELKQLIDERRQREEELWLNKLSAIARIGVQDAALFDLRTGEVSGPGGSFLIDESLLGQVAFIKEGEFSEVKGKPTLKLIGDLRPVGAIAIGTGSKPHIIRQKGIRANDIIRAFLRDEVVDDPKGYLTQICYESSSFLPCYWLIDRAAMLLTEAKAIVSAEQSTVPSKGKLIERLSGEENLRAAMPKDANANGRRKLAVRQKLLDKVAFTKLDKQGLSDVLEMMRTLEGTEIDEKYLKGQLLKIFSQHYANGDSALTDKIRRAVCYLDHELHRIDLELEDLDIPLLIEQKQR